MPIVAEDKFVAAINSYMGIIYKVCNIYFKDPLDREDGCQEILYQLWKSYPRFKGESKFSTWMYKVALNTAITYSKKGNRDLTIKLLPDDWTNFVEKQEQLSNEKMKMLYSAISGLSPTDKAITLLYLEENSYEEIAGITGLTKSNVSVKLVRIRRNLKEQLKNSIY